jgi:protein-tyrosine phosphatase
MVCLGNICRSPTAEGVLRHLLQQEQPPLPVEVDSAGTADYHVGDAPDKRSQRAARKRGIDISGLRARQVEADDFLRFDLILAMDEANLRDLRRLRPANSRAEVKLLMDYAPQAGREVPDPYYRDAAAFEKVLDLTEAASRGLIDVLRTTLQNRA